MTEEELQRRVLEQQQIKKMLELEKERLLLDQFRSPLQASRSMPPQPLIQDFLSLSGKQTNRTPYKYVSLEMDRRIAEQGVQSIINTWQHQKECFPDDAILRSIQRQSRNTSFERELTPSGKQNLEEILTEARRRSCKTKQNQSLKQKYQQRSYKKQPLIQHFQSIIDQQKFTQ